MPRWLVLLRTVGFAVLVAVAGADFRFRFSMRAAAGTFRSRGWSGLWWGSETEPVDGVDHNRGCLNALHLFEA